MAITYHVNKSVLGLAGDADGASVQAAVDSGTATTASNITNAKNEVLTAVANAGVPGEIKLVINATGTAPAGTTKLESIPVDSMFNWLSAGELRAGYLPKAFVVSDSANMKYIFAVNSNEDFITFGSTAGGTTAKRFLASAAYAPATITLSSSVADQTITALTDTGWYVYGSAVVSLSGFYAVNPAGTSSSLKLIANFTGFGTRGFANAVNTGSTVVIFNGGTTRQPTLYSQLSAAGAWEFNPATNAVTLLSAPPFQSTMGAAPGTAGLCTCSANNEVYVLLTNYYSEDAATLITSAPTDAMPVYKLSAARTWSKLGNYATPYYILAGTATQVKPSNSYCRLMYAGGYLWIVPYITTNVVVVGLVRINVSTGASSIVEVNTVQGGVLSTAQPFFHTTYVPSSLSQTVLTQDGSKVYGAVSNASNCANVISLTNTTAVQPLTTFYVKKN